MVPGGRGRAAAHAAHTGGTAPRGVEPWEDPSQETDMSLYDIPLETIDGAPSSLRAYEGRAVLIVNVASQCGLTPQYAGLQSLHETYGPRGFSVVGFPCNQFLGQEP